jgi:hypothetical protein
MLYNFNHVLFPYINRSVAGLSFWSLRFYLRSFHVGYVVDKVALRQAFFDIIPAVLHTVSFIYHRHYIIVATDSVL